MSFNLYPDQATIPDEQIVALFQEVQTEMAELLAPSLVEAYFPSASDADFMESGTGAFVNVNGTKLLITNNHVIDKGGLHHSFYGFDRFIQAAPQRYGLESPIDIGAGIVQEGDWVRHAIQALAIPFSKFAEKHETVSHEILWTAGYRGVRIKQFSIRRFLYARRFRRKSTFFTTE